MIEFRIHDVKFERRLFHNNKINATKYENLLISKTHQEENKLYIGEGVPKEEFCRISSIDIPPGHTEFYGALICLPLHFVLHIPL